jgi:hypothetical protein
MEISLIKISGVMLPLTMHDKECVDSLRNNQIINCKVTKKRNVKFHRKFYALLNYAYDLFEPPQVEINGNKIEGCKDFEEFRKWLIVKAGYYDVIGYPDGGVRLRAKSIKFSKMDDEEFSRLYSNCIDVVLKYICVQYSEQELENTLNQVMSYT